MAYYVGLDVSLKQTAICVVDGDCGVVWRGCADTHPEMILSALDRWVGKIARLGLETGSITPWLARALKARGLPVVVMDARRASDALKARPVKTDRADARALAEMLQSGWYWEVYLTSEESHRRKALLSARDQLVRNKRTFFGQIRGHAAPLPRHPLVLLVRVKTHTSSRTTSRGLLQSGPPGCRSRADGCNRRTRDRAKVGQLAEVRSSSQYLTGDPRDAVRSMARPNAERQ